MSGHADVLHACNNTDLDVHDVVDVCFRQMDQSGWAESVVNILIPLMSQHPIQQHLPCMHVKLGLLSSGERQNSKLTKLTEANARMPTIIPDCDLMCSYTTKNNIITNLKIIREILKLLANGCAVGWCLCDGRVAPEAQFRIFSRHDQRIVAPCIHLPHITPETYQKSHHSSCIL